MPGRAERDAHCRRCQIAQYRRAMTILVRPATVDDVAEACEIVRNSILHACERDHARDPQRLSDWLRNKTTENFHTWLRAPTNSGFLAFIDVRAVGVALIDARGEILLCYVHAERLHRGVGTGLLDAMTACARKQGLVRIRTHSTLTAKSFYERRGFVADGAPYADSGLIAYPLALALDTPPP